MKNSNLILVTFLIHSIAIAGSVECRVLMECAGGSAKACELRFKAPERISRKGPGAELLDEGRKLDIPRADIDQLTEAFIKDYQDAADTPGASPAAKVNVGHMKDHFDVKDLRGFSLTQYNDSISSRNPFLVNLSILLS